MLGRVGNELPCPLVLACHKELSETLLAVQYLGALRRAAEKAVETRRKQKVFLVPPGDLAAGWGIYCIITV